MSTANPLVCVFLKLPPDLQTYERKRDLAGIFGDKLDQLTVVLAASTYANTSPEVIQAVGELRETTLQHCSKLSNAIFNAYRFTTIYLIFVNHLSPHEVSRQTLKHIRRVNLNASVELEKIELARKAMAQFKQDTLDTVTRIKAALVSGNHGGDVFTAQNGQTVTELLEAVDECIALLRQTSDYFTEIESQTANERRGEIKSSIPSDEEITMIRERWMVFSTSVEAVYDSFDAIRSKLISGKNIRRADSSDGAVPPATYSSNPTGPRKGQRLILDPDTTHSSFMVSVVSFWRSLLRFIYSCLTLKCFR